MTEVSLNGVRKVYPNGHVGVHGASFDIQSGEFIVLVGPSGCGKSTTLRMIAGLEEISDGELRIDGDVVNDVAPKDRNITMVFQNYALYPHMNVYDNMAFGLRNRKHPEDEIKRRVEEAADTLGLTEILKRKPKQLSGGQRQRVAVGRSIVRRRGVFLFDEPLSNLDAKMRVQMRGEMARLHRTLGKTMIYVTHDQVEAMTLADRIIVMEAGQIRQIATPLELYKQPANKFVAGFIGSPAMNFFEGTIRQDDGLVFDGKSIGPMVKIPDAASETLGGQIGRQITLGVRPEHAKANSIEQSSDRISIPGSVEAFETTGGEAFVYLKVDGSEEPAVARVAPEPIVKPDTAMHFSVDPSQMHFFDSETGATLARTL
nr:sn-glycerol-3-phosphate ABC transporter ATP-binding protein UgpC [Hyphomonas sp. Mor2]